MAYQLQDSSPFIIVVSEENEECLDKALLLINYTSKVFVIGTSQNQRDDFRKFFKTNHSNCDFSIPKVYIYKITKIVFIILSIKNIDKF